jgi:uncharacterized protein YndB with AHSA1/START domain
MLSQAALKNVVFAHQLNKKYRYFCNNCFCNNYKNHLMPTVITIETTVNAPLAKVWQYWTGPEHIIQWNAANDDWHTTQAENDLQVGGKFSSRMEAKDGSFGFDTLEDDRTVIITFDQTQNGVTVTEQFEAETENEAELQRSGWQAILDNFKKYTERSLG